MQSEKRKQIIDAIKQNYSLKLKDFFCFMQELERLEKIDDSEYYFIIMNMANENDLLRKYLTSTRIKNKKEYMDTAIKLIPKALKDNFQETIGPISEYLLFLDDKLTNRLENGLIKYIGRLTSEKKKKLIENYYSFHYEIYSVENERYYNYYKLYNSRNINRSGGLAGFGTAIYQADEFFTRFFGKNMYLFNDVAIDSIIIDYFYNNIYDDNGSDSLAFYPYFRNECASHANDVSGVPFWPRNTDYLAEKNTVINLVFGMFDKAFPYFENLNMYVMAAVANTIIKKVSLKGDYFAGKIEQILDVKLSIPLALEFNYKEEHDSTQPDIEHGGIREYYGMCTYEVKEEICFSKVTLFMKNILKTSRDLGCEPIILMIIVYIHELVHYLYFNGISLLGKPFYPFDNNRRFKPNLFGTSEFHELLAQLVTWLIVKEDPELNDYFLKLCKVQPPIYRLWNKYDKCKIENITVLIREVNNAKIPRDIKSIEMYLESV